MNINEFTAVPETSVPTKVLNPSLLEPAQACGDKIHVYLGGYSRPFDDPDTGMVRNQSLTCRAVGPVSYPVTVSECHQWFALTTEQIKIASALYQFAQNNLSINNDCKVRVYPEGYAQVQGWLRKTGEYVNLRVECKPTAEV